VERIKRTRKWSRRRRRRRARKRAWKRRSHDVSSNMCFWRECLLRYYTS